MPFTDQSFSARRWRELLSRPGSRGESTSPELETRQGCCAGSVGIVSYVPGAGTAEICRGRDPMESSAPAGQAGPDLFFAWKLAMNIDVRAFPADYEQAAQEALSDHPRPVWASGRSPGRAGTILEGESGANDMVGIALMTCAATSRTRQCRDRIYVATLWVVGHPPVCQGGASQHHVEGRRHVRIARRRRLVLQQLYLNQATCTFTASAPAGHSSNGNRPDWSSATMASTLACGAA